MTLTKTPQAPVTRTSAALEADRTTASTTARPVRKRDKTATRARILAAAIKEFASKGMNARIEDIAEMAGANRRMAYFYFGSKEALYLAALEATYLELVESEKTIDVDGLAPRDAIAKLVSIKFDHYVRFPHYVEFIKIENLYKAQHLRTSERIQELRGPLIPIIKRVLQRGKELGQFRRDADPLDLYISICALGFFVFSNQYTLGTMFEVDMMSPELIERRRRLIVDMITAYLQADLAVVSPEAVDNLSIA